MKESNFNYISMRIKFHRLKNNLTQKSIAQMLNVAEATYNKYENHPEYLSIKRLQEIATILDCEMLDFFIR